MKMQSIEEIRADVLALGEKISTPERLLVLHDKPNSDGTPYLEISNERYSYISSERGYEIFRVETDSLDEILYLIFSRITKRIATDYEISCRVPDQDSRKILFEKQLELLGVLNPEWKKIREREIAEILQRSPYTCKGTQK